MPLPVHIELEVAGLALGWVVAERCSAGSSPPGLLEEVRKAAGAAVSERDSARSVAKKTTVRDLLRFGRARANAGLLHSGGGP